MNAYGTQFANKQNNNENNNVANDVLPFRTFMAKESAHAAKSGTIIIGGTADTIVENLNDEYGDPSEGNLHANKMVVYSKNSNIFIESNYDADVLIYNAAGQLVRAVKVYEGTNRYSGFNAGVYIINGNKLFVR